MTIYPSYYEPVSLSQSSVYPYILPPSDPFSPNAPAYIDGTSTDVLSRHDVRSRSLRLASRLRNTTHEGSLPLQRGSTITLFSPNTLLYPIIMLAATAAGIQTAFANANYTADELAHVIKDSNSSHVLVHVTLLQTSIKALLSLGYSRAEVKKRVIIVSPRNTFPPDVARAGWIALDDLVPGNAVLPEDFSGQQSKETVFIFYSSGTTGLSKGVQLSHYNVTSVLEQGRTAWAMYEHGRDVTIGVIPFFHIFGGLNLLLFSFLNGVPVVIHPGFDPVQFLSSIAKHKITVALLVPPLLRFLAKDPLVDEFDLTSLRVCVVGAAPVSPELLDKTYERMALRGANVSICQGFGLTETSSGGHFVPFDRAREKSGSVGVLMPNLEARLVDDDGTDVPVGQPGELWIRGPNITKGYTGNPQATMDTITPDGWLKTGDILTRDDEGFYAVVDRKKELIKYKGFQVPPAELEALLTTHPDIADAGVIGIYLEEEATEVPRAFIVPADPSVLDQPDHIQFVAEVQQWVKLRVARHKQLRGGIVVTDSIPRSPAGKILRRTLRESRQVPVREVLRARL